ncbi:mechanosensitive ion channel [Azospirillum sp. RWY-5-1]|uniref:Mechanosensitive ion channel n=1 Tax=Azospirillum oleiclasticum TaxID=2735135 RepID=A0ABX2T7S6_9PROT|nr:mechanosensitive ion channel domain-containing protein [Azospirillum oleiclasticum]NYZ13200.1 mechanosensitive ion channel [Azospirillum oleiclasticum]NYZ20127.1 mechanosensitive ion channel [Azospirillum oleiclasticum]
MPSTRHRWTRGFAAVLLLLITLAGWPAGAQTVPAAPASAPATTPAATTATAGPTVEQLQGVVRTLQDEAARAKLIEQLQAIITAQQAAAPAATPGAAADDRRDTLGGRLLGYAAARVEGLSHQLIQVANVFADLPRAADWAVRQAKDPSARDRWVQLLQTLGIILVAGWAIARGVGWLLARPRNALSARQLRSVLTKLPFLLLRAVLELAPVAAFAVVGYGVLSVVDPPQRVRLATLAVVNASIIVQLLLLLTRVVLSPSAPGLRLIRMEDETAAYAYVWARRLAFAAVYGYFLTEAAYVLGLPLGAYGAMMKLLGLLIATMLVILILQNRVSVAEWMRGTPLSGDGDPADTAEREAEGRGAVLRTARARLADVWHVIAILYVVVTFGVWMLNVYGGFEYLARATGLTILIAAAARLLVNGIGRVLRRGFRISAEYRESFPQLEERANRYLPLLHRVLKAVVWIVALLAILNVWGVNTVDWLESPVGRRVIGSGVTIASMLVLAVIAWELVSALIERFLSETDRHGVRIERSARVRTLLPLLRNAFLVVLVTVVALITLSELGMNIAPLLAGAGVVGLAVGFGSQTLVKDVITGLFILFEDTISVGDVVDVGGGHSGVVEAISIRTIRLRDTAGSVHSVPFSAVTTVKNLTKDFSFAVFNVSVDYKEDPDRVIEVLREIGSGMQADPAFARDLLAPLEVMGLDKLADSGIVIMARFKTRPIKQWGIGREFNRRMKKRFDEVGISIPYPHMQLVMAGGGDKALGEALSQGS